MLRIFFTILIACAVAKISFAESEATLVRIDLQTLAACDANPITEPAKASCRSIAPEQVDPQDQHIWLQARVLLPQSWLAGDVPLAVYVFGKTSSEVFFNGERLGSNGLPGKTPKEEVIGAIDAMFYIPSNLIREENQLVLRMSSHHGYLNLAMPIHFVGVGHFASPNTVLSSYTPISLALLGALVLGALYFSVVFLRGERKTSNTLMMLMTLLASIQLFAELARSLYSYPYPVHDLRLVIIVSCSFGFGICLLCYVMNRFEFKDRLTWILVCVGLSAVAIWFAEGFDAKTAFAILAPAIFATIALGTRLADGSFGSELIGYFAVFLLFDILIFVTLSVFHNLTFYLMVVSMLVYLFVRQAAELVNERAQRLEEEKQIASLNFRLEQIEQLEQPSVLKLTSSGEVIQLATNLIRFCKAAGDYVELHLVNGKQQLYSGSLKSLEEQLPKTFLKVHRSYIVNVDQVTKLLSSSKAPTGHNTLVLSGDIEVPVSRRVMPTVRQALAT